MTSSIETNYGKTVPCDDLIRSRAEALEVLIKRVKTEIKSCKSFYIGKSSIEYQLGWMRGRRRRMPFDIKQATKWNYINIDSCKRRSERTIRNSTFLILAVIDKIPKQPPGVQGSVEQYSLSLETGLIFHFMYDEPDKRLINESHHPGRSTKAPGYVIYITYDNDGSSTSSSSSSSD